MTVWPEPATVVVVLTAAAVLRSRQSRAMAGYVMVSFAASMAELCGRKPVPCLRELEGLCYDNAKAQVAADAAEAHTRQTLARVEADGAEANAARPNANEGGIDGRREVQRIEFETEAGQKRLEDARERVERAKAAVEAKGGSVYYELAQGPGGDAQGPLTIYVQGSYTTLNTNGPDVIDIEGLTKPEPDSTTEPE